MEWGYSYNNGAHTGPKSTHSLTRSDLWLNKRAKVLVVVVVIVAVIVVVVVVVAVAVMEMVVVMVL